MVDDALSDTSENPVQNKIITGEVTQLKNAIDALKIVNNASGAIASFPDGAAMPMESLTVEMEPIQNLNGQNAPYPAGGGKNLFDKTATNTDNGYVANYYLGSTGATSGSSNYNVSEYIAVKASTAYTLSSCAGGASGYCFYDSNKTYLSGGSYANNATVTFTTTADTAYIRVTIPKANIDTFQLEEGSTATAYAPYENICPISGRDSVTVMRTGKNLLPNTGESKTTAGVTWTKNADGTITVSGTATGYSDFEIGYAKVTPDMGMITLSGIDGTTNVNWGYITLRDANNEGIVNFTTGSASASLRFDISGYPNADKIRVTVKRSNNVATSGVIKPQLELGSTASAYEPYDGTSVTVQLGQTVYGGKVNFTTGEMTVDRAIKTVSAITTVSSTYIKSDATDGYIRFDGEIYPSINAMLQPNDLCADSFAFKAKAIWSATGYANCWTINSTQVHFNIANDLLGITDYTQETTETAKTKLNAYLAEHPVTLTIPIEPFTVQLAPASLSTLKGQNNVWSDADSVEVDYVCDPKLYIERLTEPDADMVADANIVNGQYFMVGNNLYLATANIASGATIVPGVNCTRTNLASALNAINS